jgi:hypothetical protein
MNDHSGFGTAFQMFYGGYSDLFQSFASYGFRQAASGTRYHSFACTIQVRK